MVKTPLVSVITVVFNAVNDIEQTVLSVIRQLNDNIEYVIIDGGSTDGTLEILEKYKEKISYLVSERDQGIYDAMNKGLAVARGKWCVFMNAGDLLYKIPVELSSTKYLSYDAFCCSVEENNHYIEKPKFKWHIKLRNTLPHQGLFYNLTRLKVQFDIQYKVYSDFNYNIWMYQNNKTVYISDEIVAYHDMLGISNNKKYSNELFSIIKNSCGQFYVVLSFIYFKFKGIQLRLKKLIR